MSVETWTSLWGRSDPEILGVYDDLVVRYSEPWRFYHTLEHVASCLAEFKLVSELALHPREVELALWYHDSVYDPQDRGNEEKSAEYTAVSLGVLIDDDSLNRIRGLILATKHDGVVSDVDKELVVDIDLAILGKPLSVYQRYEKAIREEYSWVPWRDFCARRSSILRGFLERKHIYYTEVFRVKYEEQAVRNLTSAIENLTTG